MIEFHVITARGSQLIMRLVDGKVVLPPDPEPASA